MAGYKQSYTLREIGMGEPLSEEMVQTYVPFCPILRKHAHLFIFLKKFLLNAMFHIAYDVIVNTNQLIELSALQVLFFKMFFPNGINWIAISRIPIHLRPSSVNYLELSGRLKNQCTMSTS